MSDHFYGEAPTDLGPLGLSGVWREFLHYLYLPVRIPHKEWSGRGSWDPIPRLPERLEFLRPAILTAIRDAHETAPHIDDPYVYVTARRGYATPGNPLNRPGWHTDDFGGSDLNYIWTDAYPTRFLLADEPLDISDDDQQSMKDMESLATIAGVRSATGAQRGIRIEDGSTNTLLRLTPYVIHSTPEIPEPGGMRSFFKISVSTHRYDLVGNSHNHLLDYEWPMYDRHALRNQPGAFQNKDYSGVIR